MGMNLFDNKFLIDDNGNFSGVNNSVANVIRYPLSFIGDALGAGAYGAVWGAGLGGNVADNANSSIRGFWSFVEATGQNSPSTMYPFYASGTKQGAGALAVVYAQGMTHSGTGHLFGGDYELTHSGGTGNLHGLRFTITNDTLACDTVRGINIQLVPNVAGIGLVEGILIQNTGSQTVNGGINLTGDIATGIVSAIGETQVFALNGPVGNATALDQDVHSPVFTFRSKFWDGLVSNTQDLQLRNKILNTTTGLYGLEINFGDDTNFITLRSDGSIELEGSNPAIVYEGALEFLRFVNTASAVNEFTITNAATGNSPVFSATGGDANIDLTLTPKGTGDVVVNGTDWTVTNAGVGTFATLNATTFDTNVVAAGVTLTGTTLAADGTDADININITPKGGNSVVMSRVDINAGTIDGATIATSDITVGAGKTLNVSAGTLTLADNQISGDKVEGGTIAAITITDLAGATIDLDKAGVLAVLTNTTDNASVQIATFEGDRATPTDNDAAYFGLFLSDSAGNQDEQARITWKATTVLSGATQDGDLILSSLVNNVLTDMLTLDGSVGNVNVGVVLQQNDAIYFTQTDGNEKIDSAADGYLDYTVTTAHRFNMATADTDVRLEFIGTTNSGLIEWMEDEDYFRVSDSLFMVRGLIGKQGSDIASASTIAIPTDGNTFELTGTTAVNLITTTGYQDGFEIMLIANENVTVNHGTATSGANVTILLAGAANFSMTANDTLKLVLSSTTAGGQAWRETGRTTI